MPNTNRIISPYIPDGNPDHMNVASLYAPGDLGAAFDFNDRAYQVVQVDSGATVSTPIGVVAEHQLAFWKDKDKYLVTNDDRVAIGQPTANAFRNQVAGVFRVAATAGRYVCILQRADHVYVHGAQGGGIGQTIIAQTTGTGQVTFEAVGGNRTYQKLGVAREATSATLANHVYVDLDITNIP